MASLPEQYDWTPGIYQLETSDPVLGGAEGIDNLQAKQLASRTQWLKNQLATGGVNVPAPQVVGKIADLGMTRFISTAEQTTDRPAGIDYATGMHVVFTENGFSFDFLAGVSIEQFSVRKNAPGAPGPWRSLFHTGNFDPGDKADKSNLPFRGVAMYATPGVFMWLVPVGVTKAWVEVYGGGGGGAMSSTAPGASGGGGGGVAMKLVSVNPGDSITITVGTGGNGGATDKSVGSAGGTSSFGSFCSATGGFGGSVNSTLGTPGTGTGGDINYRIGIGAGAITPPEGGLHGGAGGGGESAAAGVDTTRPSQPGMGGGGRIAGGGAPGGHGAVRIYY